MDGGSTEIKTNEKDIDIAHDYRGQQQTKYGTEMPSLMMQAIPILKPKLVAHLKSFLPDRATEELNQQLDNIATNSDRKTSLDEPFGCAIMQNLCLQIESAAVGLNLPLHEGVSAGVLHTAKTEAMQQPVMMTDASVVQMTANMLMLCNRLAKLLARTVVEVAPFV